jgi:hypothetical protein
VRKNLKNALVGGAVAIALVGSTAPLSVTSVAAAAAGPIEAATVTPTSGSKTTAFQLDLGANPACPGDSATGGYRWQTFLVPDGTDLEQLTFGSNGPVSPDGGFASPLFTTFGDAVVNQTTAQAVGGDPAGGIFGIPQFNLDVFSNEDLPSGRYAVGVACTLGPAGSDQVSNIWTTDLRVVGSPSGPTWSTVDPVDNGDATLSVTSGDSATAFALGLGDNPSCPGDSASGGYRWQTFMVPATTDLSTLAFTTAGPVAVAGEFRSPLYTVAGDPVTNQLTDQAVGGEVTGGISGIPAANLAVFDPGTIPGDVYSVGVACTLGVPSATQVASYWSTTIRVVGLATGGGPAQVAWSTDAGPDDEGAATLTFTSGDDETPFRLRSFTLGLGASPSCPGDSATLGYRWQTFMVPASADPAGLTFTTSGPMPVTGQFRTALYSTAGDPVVNQFTAQAVGGDPAGGIFGIPTMRLDVFDAGVIPAGDYLVGVACTLGVPSLTQTSSYWSTTVTVAAEEDEEVPGVPGAPQVTLGIGTLDVVVVPPTTGGTPTSYTVTATGVSPGAVTRTCTVSGASGSCTVAGLTQTGRYRVSVVATNGAGSSAASATTPGTPESITPGAGSATPQFGDVPAGAYFVRAVSMLKDRGITQGKSATRYAPEDQVTREEMAAFLYRLAGSPQAPACTFRDQASIAVWARPAACWLKEQGITEIDPYLPNRPVNRAEMAAFLHRLAGSPSAPPYTFRDQASIPSWARPAASWLRDQEITRNDPYRPVDQVTRAEMAAFLYRTGAAFGLWLQVD